MIKENKKWPKELSEKIATALSHLRRVPEFEFMENAQSIKQIEEVGLEAGNLIKQLPKETVKKRIGSLGTIIILKRITSHAIPFVTFLALSRVVYKMMEHHLGAEDRYIATAVFAVLLVVAGLSLRNLVDYSIEVTKDEKQFLEKFLGKAGQGPAK